MKRQSLILFCLLLILSSCQWHFSSWFSDETGQEGKIYRYDRPALTLIAATLYSQERFDNGQIYSAWHLLPVPEEVDDQDYEFESYDLEVEALAQAGDKT